ncbi:MAG TPA: hypothetical protein VGS79_28805 [Puia sp.]|nr:hypothetical protein [Puia sp.]
MAGLALAILFFLHAFADSGKATTLATMASERYEGVAADPAAIISK